MTGRGIKKKRELQNTTTENCLGLTELKEFVAEEAGMDLAKKIEDHLRACESCFERLNGIQDSNSRKCESLRKMLQKVRRDELPELPKGLFEALLEIEKTQLRSD